MEKKEQIQTEDENQINLSIKHNSKAIFEIPITKSENLFEIRNVIADLPELYFTPNFHFDHEGKKLNEFEDLQNEIELDDVKELVLNVVQDDYDLRTLKDLIVRTNTFFEDPKGVASTLKFEQNNAMAKIDFFNITELKRRKSKKNKTKLDLDKSLEGNIVTLTQISNDHSIKPGLKSDGTFIKLLEYSNWNPPPRRRKMIGDFLYLKIETLEGKAFHVTAFSQGFYKNKSTDSKFDPTPDSIIYYSVLELIASESLSFKAKLEQGIFENYNLQVKHINLPESKRPQKWLTHDDDIEEHKPNFFNAGMDIFNNHGNNINQYRDWNEELYNCKELPEDEIFLKLNKKKTQWKIASEFLEAAKCGAKAIIDGDLKPFNYNMSESEQCFVYNNIFYTYAIDDYMNLTQQRGENSPSTLALANNDLRNMSILLNSDIKGIETINTALIYYKGHVIMAQSMIQGILHFDQKTWSKYGSIEEGKEIFFDEGFHGYMKKISKLFSITDENKFKDGDGKEFNLATSIDIKGIQGGDGRKYVLDILRLSPRDLNWLEEKDEDEYNCCVLRLGLIKAYIASVKVDKVKEIRDQYSEELIRNKQENLISVQKKINEKRLEIMKARKEQAEKDGGKKQEKIEQPKLDFDEEDKGKIEEYNRINTEISKKIENEINETFKDNQIDGMRFNPCMFTNLTSLQMTDEETKEERGNLENLSTFIKDGMITKLLIEWPQMIKLSPMDSESIASFFHKYSVNLRYLGLVCQKMDQEFFTFQKILVQRTMVTRALKHFFNEVLRTISPLHISQTISYLLNLILGSKKVACYLNQKCKKMRKSQRLLSPNSSSSSSSGSERRKLKKKNRKKAKRKIRQIDTNIPPNEYMLLNSTDLFEKIKEIVEYRFRYKFEESEFYELKFCKKQKSVQSFLRDICKSIGLVLRIRNFEFRNSCDENFDFKEGAKITNVHLPIKDTDVIEFTARVKHTIYEFSEVKKNIELANKFIKSQNYDMALEIFSSCHHMLLSIYGPFFGACIESASNLSSLSAISGKIEQAIAMQKIIIEVSEKTFGIDDIFTLNAITILAGYYYENKNQDKAIQTLLKSLYLADLVGGEYNSESMRFLDELHMLYFEKGDLQKSIRCCHEKTERLKDLFKESHPLILKCYQRLGYLYLKHNNPQTALQYFQQRLALIKKFHSSNLQKEIEKSEKFIEIIKGKLDGGKNQATGEELSELEIETLKERVKIFKAMRKRKNF